MKKIERGERNWECWKELRNRIKKEKVIRAGGKRKEKNLCREEGGTQRK